MIKGMEEYFFKHNQAMQFGDPKTPKEQIHQAVLGEGSMNNKIFIANLKERREEFKSQFGMYPEQRKNQQLADEIERIAREKAEARKRQLTSAVARYNFHTSGSVLKVQNGPIVSKSKRVTKAGASAVLEQGKIDLQNK